MFRQPTYYDQVHILNQGKNHWITHGLIAIGFQAMSAYNDVEADWKLEDHRLNAHRKNIRRHHLSASDHRPL